MGKPLNCYPAQNC